MRLLGTLLLTSMCISAHDANDTIPQMVMTAKNLLASLDDAAKAKALFPFEDSERTFMHYIPAVDVQKQNPARRLGLPLIDMSPYQKHLAAALMSAGLSTQGYIKATTIMSLEDVLRILEKDSGDRRNPEKYYFSIFGEPSLKGPWSYRIQGHHVSLHYTIVNGKVTGNPQFFGSNPAEVRVGPRQGLRVLAAEEDKARALLDTLTPAQKKVAIITETAYPDILTTTKREAALEGKPAGLPASQMTPAQRRLLDALLAEYINNLPEPLSTQRQARVKQAGADLYFAWAGVLERGGPHYYRVQSPTFLVEYDNTQNNANHIHCVWRDFTGDWGEDVLQEHYKQSH
jgi:hypothetical protein